MYALYLLFTLECTFITPTLCLCPPLTPDPSDPHAASSTIFTVYTRSVVSLTCTSHSYWQGRPVALSTNTPHITKLWNEFAQNYSFRVLFDLNFLLLLKRFNEARQLSQYSDYATGWTIRGSIPGMTKNVLSSPKCRDRLWGPFNVVYNGNRCSFPGVKADGSWRNSLSI